MAVNVRPDGKSWTAAKTIYVKVNGVWKQATVHVKVNGAWKKV